MPLVIEPQTDENKGNRRGVWRRCQRFRTARDENVRLNDTLTEVHD